MNTEQQPTMSLSDMIKWCGESEGRLLSFIDTMLDKGLDEPEVKQKLELASEILEEIEEIEKEIEELLLSNDD